MEEDHVVDDMMWCKISERISKILMSVSIWKIEWGCTGAYVTYRSSGTRMARIWKLQPCTAREIIYNLKCSRVAKLWIETTWTTALTWSQWQLGRSDNLARCLRTSGSHFQTESRTRHVREGFSQMVREEFIRHAKHQMELRPTGTMGFRADPSPSPPRCTDLVLGGWHIPIPYLGGTTYQGLWDPS